MMLPLEGIRVLELAMVHQGPGAAATLADWGADVIKIEGPNSPDRTRGAVQAGSSGSVNALFETLNRNKRSVIVDLKHPDGQAVLHRLIPKVDVFLQNLGPGTAERLNAGYDTLSAINPRLIYATGTAFGDRGPHAHRRGMDRSVQARSGLMSITGDEGTAPIGVRGAPVDQVGAMLLAFGVVMALYQRERIGRGQEIQTSLLEGMIYFHSWRLSSFLFSGDLRPRHDFHRYTHPLWNVFKGSDGRWFATSEGQYTRWWPVMCRAIGCEELEEHPAMTVPPDEEKMGDLIDQLDALFSTRPAVEWIDRMLEVGISVDPVQDFAEVVEDPQVIANDMIVEYDHPVAGKLRVPNFGVRLSGSQPTIKRPAPEYGQHTEEVLLEYGFTWDEIVTLREQGAVGHLEPSRP